MEIALTEHFAKFIDSKVEEGRYENASEVVRDALRNFEASERPIKGAMDGDMLEPLFIVLKEAVKSNQEDLKMIMNKVKAINATTQGLSGQVVSSRPSTVSNLMFVAVQALKQAHSNVVQQHDAIMNYAKSTTRKDAKRQATTAVSEMQKQKAAIAAMLAAANGALGATIVHTGGDIGIPSGPIPEPPHFVGGGGMSVGIPVPLLP